MQKKDLKKVLAMAVKMDLMMLKSQVLAIKGIIPGIKLEKNQVQRLTQLQEKRLAVLLEMKKAIS